VRSSSLLYTTMLAVGLLANQFMMEYDLPLLARISGCFVVGMCVAIVWRWMERRARRRRL
jgi:hypothetical protein